MPIESSHLSLKLIGANSDQRKVVVSSSTKSDTEMGAAKITVALAMYCLVGVVRTASLAPDSASLYQQGGQNHEPYLAKSQRETEILNRQFADYIEHNCPINPKTNHDERRNCIEEQLRFQNERIRKVLNPSVPRLEPSFDEYLAKSTEEKQALGRKVVEYMVRNCPINPRKYEDYVRCTEEQRKQYWEYQRKSQHTDQQRREQQQRDEYEKRKKLETEKLERARLNKLPVTATIKIISGNASQNHRASRGTNVSKQPKQ